jgi:hypothetical protein
MSNFVPRVQISVPPVMLVLISAPVPLALMPGFVLLTLTQDPVLLAQILALVLRALILAPVQLVWISAPVPFSLMPGFVLLAFLCPISHEG